MAGVSQILNWSKYQDRQLNVLNSLEKSFSASLRSSKLIEDSLSRVKTSLDSIFTSARSLTETMYSISSQKKEDLRTSKALNLSLRSVTTSMKNLDKATESRIRVEEQLTSVLKERVNNEGTSQIQRDNSILESISYSSSLLVSIEDKLEEILTIDRTPTEDCGCSDILNDILKENRGSSSTLVRIEDKIEDIIRDRDLDRMQPQDDRDSLYDVTLDSYDTLTRIEDILKDIKSDITSGSGGNGGSRGNGGAGGGSGGHGASENDKLILRIFSLFDSKIASTIGEQANKFSELSNRLLEVSGSSGESIRGLREDIVEGITDSLNADTGGFYSPQEVYKQMINIASGANIGNLETIKELTRPMLLAQESMDLEVSNLATLLNRWHTRYSFSSIAMEELVNDIRSSTSNNQASAEATVENLKTLDNWMAYYARGDESKLSEMAESISNGTAWLESMNIDTARYTEYIADIASGDAASNSQLIQVLDRVGLSALEAQKMFASGDINKLYEALFSGEVEIFRQMDQNNIEVMSQVAEAMGMDVDQLLEAYNAAMSSNYKSLIDFEKNKDTTTAAEIVADKYVSATDRANNWLEKIYNQFADWQESMGFGLSDLAGMYVLMKGFQGSWKTVTTLFPKLVPVLQSLGTWASRGSSGSGILSTLAGAGSNLGGAAMLGGGVLAGAGLAIDGGMGVFDKESDTASRVLSGVEAAGGIAGAAGLIALGVTNPVGWIALAIGGAALAAKEIHKAVTPVSGAAKSIEKEFDNLRESFKEEQFDRVAQLETLKQSIRATSDLDEQRQLALDSGLVSIDEFLEAAKTDTSLTLDEFISNLQEATSSLISLHDAALDAAEGIVADEVKKQDSQIEQELYTKVAGMMTDGKLTKDDANYGIVKEVFTQIANSITDDEARSKALADINTVFKNGVLSDSELKFLTDTGGNMRALFSTELDRKDNAFRQAGDFDRKNAALSLLGISGYDTSSMDTINKLDEIYRAWALAVAAEDKSKYVSQYKSIYDTLDPSLQAAYLEEAKSMGIKAYAEGTNYITKDQIAVVHEGEAITPKRYNPMANLNELERLREQINTERSRDKEDSDDSQEYIKFSYEVLKDIKDFLSYWREDNIRRENSIEAKTRFSSSSRYISQYMLNSN